MKIAIGVMVAVWLAVGVFSANQRHYFGGLNSCDAGATVAVTIAAGPLNYGGAHPVASCPEPTT
jgi:hypothetical protein